MSADAGGPYVALLNYVTQLAKGVPGQDHLVSDLANILEAIEKTEARLNLIGKNDRLTPQDRQDIEEMRIEFTEKVQRIFMWEKISKEKSKLVNRLMQVIKLDKELEDYRNKFESSTLNKDTESVQDNLSKQIDLSGASDEVKQMFNDFLRAKYNLDESFRKTSKMINELEPFKKKIDLSLLESTNAAARESASRIKTSLQRIIRRRRLRWLLRHSVNIILSIIILMLLADLFISGTVSGLIRYGWIAHWLEQASKLVFLGTLGLFIEFFMRKRIDNLIAKIELNHLFKDNNEVHETLLLSRMLFAVVESQFWHMLLKLMPSDIQTNFYRQTGWLNGNPQEGKGDKTL